MAKQGHPVWELRAAEEDDGGNAVLVRKKEEPERRASRGGRVWKGQRVACIRRGQVEMGFIESLVDALGKVLEEADLGEEDEVVVEVMFDDGLDTLPMDCLMLDDDVEVEDCLEEAEDEINDIEEALGVEDEEEEDEAAHDDEGDEDDDHHGFSAQLKRAVNHLAGAVERAMERGNKPGSCDGCA